MNREDFNRYYEASAFAFEDKVLVVSGDTLYTIPCEHGAQLVPFKSGIKPSTFEETYTPALPRCLGWINFREEGFARPVRYVRKGYLKCVHYTQGIVDTRLSRNISGGELYDVFFPSYYSFAHAIEQSAKTKNFAAISPMFAVSTDMRKKYLYMGTKCIGRITLRGAVVLPEQLAYLAELIDFAEVSVR